MMPSKITFPPEEFADGSRLVIIFHAIVDAKWVPCEISFEALEAGFGGDLFDGLETFRKHRAEIEKTAERLILKGRYGAGGGEF